MTTNNPPLTRNEWFKRELTEVLLNKIMHDRVDLVALSDHQQTNLRWSIRRAIDEFVLENFELIHLQGQAND